MLRQHFPWIEDTIGVKCVFHHAHDLQCFAMLICHVSPLADADTMVVAQAERAVARVLEATCQVPLAVHGVLQEGVVHLRSMVSSADGKQAVRAEGKAPASDATALGERVAADLLANGAGEIISSL